MDKVVQPVLEQPSDENIKIWRYMDFTKFISLIESSTLFFASAASFTDPYEGSWTVKDLKLRDELFKALKERGARDEALEEMTRVLKYLPTRVGISCWHESEYESAAMWDLYLKTNEGVAIQTTYSRLKNSFKDTSKLHFGRIRYIDFNTEQMMDDFETRSMVATFAYKRKSFEHEKEIRVLYMEDIPPNSDVEKINIGGGVAFDIDLNTLIENIYISPTAPAWFASLVRNYLNKYKYNFPSTKSSLYEGALF